MFTNPDFERPIGGTPTGWTRESKLNPQITDTRPNPQTLASLNLNLNLAAGGALMTTVVGGAPESQIDPDIGTSGSFRYPRYGTRAARVNYQDTTTTGKNRNVNTLRQPMMITAEDIDPLDHKIHVRFAVAGAALAAVLALTAAPAAAQTANGSDTSGARAINRLHPAAADSEWFALDSVGFTGHRGVSLAATGDYGYRPLVIYNTDSSRRIDIVRDQLVVHFAASVTLYERFRLSAVAPLAAWQNGNASRYDGMPMAGPTYAFGDVAIAGDVRLAGTSDSRLRVAAGLQLITPTGSRTYYMSDGIFAVDGHVLVAGTVGLLEYAADARILIRERTMLVGEEFGPELRYAAAAGLRLVDGKLVIGPELLGALPVVRNLDVGNPVEVGLGAHYRFSEAVRAGAGASMGLVHAVGTPEARAMLSVVWIP